MIIMQKLFFTILLSVIFSSSYSQVKTVNFNQLEPRLSTGSDSLYIVNFWATWCVPCVKELPEFEKINEQFSGRKVKVLLVSLDNSDHIDSRVLPFIDKHNLKSEIILLDDPQSNKWIPEVDESWSGSIPATIIFSSNSRAFYEKMFTYDELEEIVNSYLD